MAENITHRGGCHCGRVRFEVDAPARIEALDCNCSICRMTGFLHLIVPASRFRLVAGGTLQRAANVGVGAWIGFLVGTVLKLGVSFAMLGLFALAFIMH